MCDSAANCSRHVLSVSIVVGALLSRHSSALNDRPSRGVTPRNGKKLQVTGTRVRRCVSPCACEDRVADTIVGEVAGDAR